MENNTFTEYIFSKLADLDFDMEGSLRSNFTEPELDYMDELFEQFDNFKREREVKVADLINEQILEGHSELKELILLMCIYRIRTSPVGAPNEARKTLRKNISKIFRKPDIADIELERILNSQLKNGFFGYSLCTQSEFNEVTLDTIVGASQYNLTEDEEEETIVFSSLS